MRKNERNQSVNETKLTCPKCGTEFAIPGKTHVTIGIAIGKDSNLGTIHPEVAGQEKPADKLPSKATDRIEALRAAGVDVSGFFAMTGANGGDFVAKNVNGNLTILSDDDPVYDQILGKGDVYNPKLARRWVMAQMFHMLACEQGKDFSQYYYKRSITEQIRQRGYDYMWKQLEDELHAQWKMQKNGDKENFEDRNRWFNKELVVAMLEDYRYQLHLHVKHHVKEQKCKGVPYKRVCDENVFVEDIQKKVFAPIEELKKKVASCEKPYTLYWLVCHFNRSMRKQRGWQPKQSAAWLDAYKGAGAFFTMQNMIRYHRCVMVLDGGDKLDKLSSYSCLKGLVIQYKHEGWRMIGVLRKFLKDNNIDIKKKMAEWRKRK